MKLVEDRNMSSWDYLANLQKKVELNCQFYEKKIVFLQKNCGNGLRLGMTEVSLIILLVRRVLASTVK